MLRRSVDELMGISFRSDSRMRSMELRLDFDSGNPVYVIRAHFSDEYAHHGIHCIIVYFTMLIAFFIVVSVIVFLV